MPGKVLRIGDEERTVNKGDFYCIPANIPHGDTCIGDEPFAMLDIFYPIRDEFVKRIREHHGELAEPTKTTNNK